MLVEGRSSQSSPLWVFNFSKDVTLLKKKAPSTHLNFMSHDFISDSGHLGSWSLISTLIKWNLECFHTEMWKQKGFFSAWLSLLLPWSTTQINYFLFSVHHIIFESMSVSCSLTVLAHIGCFSGYKSWQSKIYSEE